MNNTVTVRQRQSYRMQNSDNILAIFVGLLTNILAQLANVHFAQIFMDMPLLDANWFVSFVHKLLDVGFFTFVGGIMAILGKKTGELLYKLPLVQRYMGRFVKTKEGDKPSE